MEETGHEEDGERGKVISQRLLLTERVPENHKGELLVKMGLRRLQEQEQGREEEKN